MTASTLARSGVSILQVLLIAFFAFVFGVLLTVGAAAIHRWITDDSRPSMTIADVIAADDPSFANAGPPSKDACGNERDGCVEGRVGDGVAVYRYASLNYARLAITGGDADFYRADRLVFEFDEDVTLDERGSLLLGVEGFMTDSGE